MKTVVVRGIKFEVTLKLTEDTTIKTVKELVERQLSQKENTAMVLNLY